MIPHKAQGTLLLEQSQPYPLVGVPKVVKTWPFSAITGVAAALEGGATTQASGMGGLESDLVGVGPIARDLALQQADPDPCQ